jgi:ribose transport system substrate-binding protein
VVTAAKAAAAKYEQIPPTWPGPKTSPLGVHGKKVMILSCSQATACAQEAAGTEAAAKILGWQTGPVVDGKGDPNVMSSAIRNAVTSGVQGIILAGTIPTLAIRPALAFAKAHHVLVEDNFDAPPAARGFPDGDPLITGGDNSAPNGPEGTAMANYIIANSDGKANVINFTDNEFASLKYRTSTLLAQLKKCTTCKLLANINLSVNTVASSAMTTQVESVLSQFGAKPNEYIVLPYSAADTFAIQALKVNHRTDVKLISWSPSAPQVQYCHLGLENALNVEGSEPWDGWQAVDELNRAFAGKPPVNEGTPYFLLTQKTCPGAVDPSTLFKSFSFENEYESLWKTGHAQ